MATEVVMPQMGESITEGTITKWLKQVGEKVERDEMIFEISTDKVDAEIPSPVAGVLLQILHGEGETLEVGKVVAVVGAEGETGAPAASNGNSANGRAATQKTAAPDAQPESAGLAAEQESAEAMNAETPGATAPPEEIAAPAPVQAASPQQDSQIAAPASSEGATEIVMPQMGESITEGTITKWLKQVGEKVERDEMIFEISTDKVDAEIPSPVAGTLLEIRGKEGETLEVGTIVALVGATVNSQQSTVNSQTLQTSTLKSEISKPKIEDAGHPEQAETAGRSYDYQRPDAVEESEKIPANGQNSQAVAAVNGNGNASVEDLRRTKSSPLVRKIAAEHSIDISQISGTGASGRVTKEDIMGFIAAGKALTPQQAMATAKSGATLPNAGTQAQIQPQQFVAPQIQAQTPAIAAAANQTPAIVPASAVGDRIEPMSVMRKKIAQHMTLSKQTSAHVTSVYEIDMTQVAKFRDQNKAGFQSRYGTKLSYMPFIFQAVTAGLRNFPIINSQVSGENIVYKGDINLGMAVALDWGLIVPVIKRADTLSLAGLAMTANDLAERARTKKLMPDEVSGGTFTITNPGVFGGLFGTPIINQPQVAILCVGTIEKRPKVITSPEGDDYLAIRTMAYFALTYDHRVVDGADAEKFLSFLKENLEAGQFVI